MNGILPAPAVAMPQLASWLSRSPDSAACASRGLAAIALRIPPPTA